MAKDNIRSDTPPPPPFPEDQFSEILLIADKQKNIIEAVSELNAKGKAETVPAEEENKNSFLKINWNSNIVKNFIENFRRQFANPTRFTLIKMALGDFKNNREALRELAEGKQTERVKEFLKKYEIVPKEINESKDLNSNNLKSEIMAKQNEVNSPEVPQQSGTRQQNNTDYRFNESMIDFDQLRFFGIDKEYLKKAKLLEPMLRGYKTDKLVPILMNLGSVVLRTDARLSFQQSNNGVVLAIHGVRKAPELDKPYFGHVFSVEDKKNLRETGNMGRTVELKGRDGQYAPCFVSMDKLTNEIVASKVDSTFIPNNVQNIELNDFEKNELKEGREIYLEGLKTPKGKEYNAFVQIDASKRGITYRFENDRLYNQQELYGVPLTQQQKDNLNAGKAIFVEDMTRTDGEKFTAFVKLNETGRPHCTRYNPDTPEGAREIYIPKELHGTTLTPEDRQELRAGKPVFIENMIGKDGNEFSRFVKFDLETGNPKYSKTPDGFDENKKIEIPAEYYGVTFTATQRATLQDGKTLHIENFKGPKEQFSGYLKQNPNTGILNYYKEDPDKKKTTQQNVVTQNTPRQDANKGASQNASQDAKSTTSQSARTTQKTTTKQTTTKAKKGAKPSM